MNNTQYTTSLNARRYEWLRDNGHLDRWWSVQGPKDKSKNIDTDIDNAMSELAIKPGAGKPTICHKHG